MSDYTITLTKEQEEFLDIYLVAYPLRKEHKREDYPSIVANNFINSLMARRAIVEEAYLNKVKGA